MEQAIPQQHQYLMESIIKDKFDFEPSDFTFNQLTSGNNNYVYCIDLSAAPKTSRVARSSCVSKPLTSPIPSDVEKVILRISKSNVSLVDSVRIRNEVAFLKLGGDALASLGGLTPQVYDWSDDGPSENHWILQEWKQGNSLSQKEFQALEAPVQENIMTQVAQIAKHFQEYQLPESFIHGGITFDDDGVMSSTEPVIPCGGPFPNYVSLLRGMCKWQLSAADRSQHINGWKDIPGLRNRIDTFFEQGLEKVLDWVSEDRPTLIHGDLGLANLLFDPSYRITAVLDFDFAHIAHPVSEFLFSFLDFHGLLLSTIEPEGRLQGLQIQGFPDDTDYLDDILKMAKSWDRVLKDTGNRRPSTIPGAETVADIWWFSQELCQPFWLIERWVANRTEEQLAETKARCATKLDEYLTSWGY